MSNFPFFFIGIGNILSKSVQSFVLLSIKRPMSISLSVVIITYNEEAKIARCLDSIIPIADEVIVLDSFSTDNTKQICQQYDVKFYEHTFDGHIEQKNRALTLTSNDYVLSLDADEALDDIARQEVLAIKTNWQFNGYYFKRLNNYCGQWIKHSGWYPDWKLRLFEKNKAEWKGRNPHDRLDLKAGASSKNLKGNILHYTIDSIEQHLAQIDYFSSVASKALFDQGKKYSLLKKYSSMLAIFFRCYLIKLGFLDGKNGLLIAKNSAYSKYLKYKKLELLHKSK